MNADVGAPAPDFDLESDAGKYMSLSDFAGRWLVLYFYPRDNTPGCTIEAQAFTEALTGFRKAGAEVVGISRDSVLSHGSFRDKFNIRFPLLSDPELATHEAYGAWGTKMMYGKQVEGTIRSTFLIAPDGRIARVWKGVKVNGHADAVASALAELGNGAAGAPAATPATEVSATGAPAKKTSAKKAPATKTSAKKAAARPAPAVKTSAKGRGPRAAAKAAKTAAAKNVVARKTPGKKPAPGKMGARKAGATEVAPARATAGKAGAKASAKKPSGKKALSGKRARRP
jgi:peroxiredoxin Q/BCP